MGKTTPKVPFFKDSGRYRKILGYTLATYAVLPSPSVFNRPDVFLIDQVYLQNKWTDKHSILPLNSGCIGENNFCKFYKPEKSGTMSEGRGIILLKNYLGRNQRLMARIFNTESDSVGMVWSMKLKVKDVALKQPINKIVFIGEKWWWIVGLNFNQRTCCKLCQNGSHIKESEMLWPEKNINAIFWNIVGSCLCVNFIPMSFSHVSWPSSILLYLYMKQAT